MIRDAFRRKSVDISIAGDVEDVEISLGLRAHRARSHPVMQFCRQIGRHDSLHPQSSTRSRFCPDAKRSVVTIHVRAAVGKNTRSAACDSQAFQHKVCQTSLRSWPTISTGPECLLGRVPSLYGSAGRPREPNDRREQAGNPRSISGRTDTWHRVPSRRLQISPAIRSTFMWWPSVEAATRASNSPTRACSRPASSP